MSNTSVAPDGAWATPPGPDCLPFFKYSTCGPTYQLALNCYYWVVFVLWMISFVHVLHQAVSRFRGYCGRADPAKAGKKYGLRVYILMCLPACGCHAIYSYFLTRGDANGMPPWLLAGFYSTALNLLLMCIVLVILTWAEAVDDDKLSVTNSWLSKYKMHFWLIAAERVLFNILPVMLSGANIPGTYLIFWRIWAFEFVISLPAASIAAFIYGNRMIVRLEQAGLETVKKRVRRVQLLFSAPLAAAGVYCGVQGAMQHIVDQSPVAWFIFNAACLLANMVVVAWFLVSRPGRIDDFSKQKSTTATLSRDGGTKTKSASMV